MGAVSGGRGLQADTGPLFPCSGSSRTLERRMAAAAYGLQCTGTGTGTGTGSNNNNGSSSSKSHKERQRKAKDSRRRQAALLFLSNISLDGRPTCQLSNGNPDQGDSGEHRVRDAGAAAGSLESIARASPTPFQGIGVVSPVRPSLVMSPGPGASEVFLEAGSEDTVHLLFDTPLSPVPPGHQPGSSAKSPSVLSPAPGVGAPHLDSRQRSRNVSSSPGPKLTKKVHFIKSLRQYDTRGCSDPKLESQRQRLSSVVAVDLLPSLEGVELGAYGKTVSYAQFLFPTNALVRQKGAGGPESCAAPNLQSRFRGNAQRNLTSASLSSAVTQDPCIEDLAEYDPNLLSDPQWPCGRHKRVLIFASYVTSVIEYVKPSDLKKNMNEMFKEKFPHIKLTLSKIRSLKREMRAVSEECGLQPVTVAMAFVYFEKLVLHGHLNKQNRKLVSAACVLLAAKISSDLRKPEVRQLIDKLEERFRINRRELIPLEFQVLVALEMGLYLPDSKVMPHYRRLVQQG